MSRHPRFRATPSVHHPSLRPTVATEALPCDDATPEPPPARMPWIPESSSQPPSPPGRSSPAPPRVPPKPIFTDWDSSRVEPRGRESPAAAAQRAVGEITRGVLVQGVPASPTSPFGRTADDAKLVAALGQLESPYAALRSAGCAPKAAAYAAELLETAQAAPALKNRSRCRCRQWVGLFFFAGLCLIIAGVFLEVTSSDGWRDGLCNLQGYSNGTCDVGDCRFTVSIREHETNAFFLHPGWPPPVRRDQDILVVDGAPLACCDSGRSLDCCSFYDADTYKYCDNFGGDCPSGAWECLFHAEDGGDGYGLVVTDLIIFEPPPTVHLVVSGSLAWCVALATRYVRPSKEPRNGNALRHLAKGQESPGLLPTGSPSTPGMSARRDSDIDLPHMPEPRPTSPDSSQSPETRPRNTKSRFSVASPLSSRAGRGFTGLMKGRDAHASPEGSEPRTAEALGTERSMGFKISDGRQVQFAGGAAAGVSDDEDSEDEAQQVHAEETTSLEIAENKNAADAPQSAATAASGGQPKQQNPVMSDAYQMKLLAQGIGLRLFEPEAPSDFETFPSVSGRQSAGIFEPVVTPRATVWEPSCADCEGAVPGTPQTTVWAWGSSGDVGARIAAALSPSPSPKSLRPLSKLDSRPASRRGGPGSDRSTRSPSVRSPISPATPPHGRVRGTVGNLNQAWN